MAYSEQQIQAVLNNPNQFPPALILEMEQNGCFTIEDLRAHGLSAASEQKINYQRAYIMEESHYRRCMSHDATYDILEDFIRTYPTSAHKNEVEQILTPMRIERQAFEQFLSEYRNLPEESFEDRFKKLNSYRISNPDSRFLNEIQTMINTLDAQQEAWNQRMRELEEQRERDVTDDRAWDNVLGIISSAAYDEDYKLSVLDEYYNNSQYSRHKHEVHAKRDEILNEKNAIPAIEAVLSEPHSTVVDFLELYKRYPSKRVLIKDRIIDDMKSNPNRYSREGMYLLLKGSEQYPAMFSSSELVLANVAPSHIWNHILNHPSDSYDKSPDEDMLQVENNFDSERHNTDIYFFGVPGSGKTTVLSGLFNVDRYENLRLHLEGHGTHPNGYSYACILQKYPSENLFPQSTKTVQESENDTGDKYIQIVDAELTESQKDKKHKLSIIEMPGERTLAFAAADIRDPEMMDELLGKGTKELFCNDNRKVFFFVIDPKPYRSYEVKLNGSPVHITQKQVLSALVDFLGSVPGLLEKVDAMHIILSKSDMLSNPDDFSVIQDEILDKGYNDVIEEINILCSKSRGNVNAHCGHRPYLFTFSLGKLYPGHMIEFKKDDAAKILKVIAANTYSVAAVPSKWSSFVEWMNR